MQQNFNPKQFDPFSLACPMVKDSAKMSQVRQLREPSPIAINQNTDMPLLGVFQILKALTLTRPIIISCKSK